MKKIFAFILVASAISFSSSAQKGGMGMAKQTLMDSLKISGSVADSVIAVRQQSMSQVKTIMSDQSLTKDQKKEKMKPVKEEMKTKLEKFLTQEQMQKLQQMEMERRQGKGGQSKDDQ